MNLFQHGQFTLHSGASSTFKIDCDALTDEDIDAIAQIIVGWMQPKMIPICGVLGIPRGGIRLCNFIGMHLAKANLIKPDGQLLIVDDVLTTGKSMEAARLQHDNAGPPLGAVIFARTRPAPWIRPVFQMWSP